MYTSDYDRTSNPHSQIVEIEIRNPALPNREKIKGLVDSGADISTITKGLIQKLGLIPSGYERIAGIDGREEIRPVYYVKLLVPGHIEMDIDAVEDEKELLIGRDILNKIVVILDGIREQLIILDKREHFEIKR